MRKSIPQLKSFWRWNEMNIEELLSGATGKLISVVSSNPYIERGQLQEEVGLEEKDFEETLKKLLEEKILIKMTRHSSSSMESRSPIIVYLVNPEKESELSLGE